MTTGKNNTYTKKNMEKLWKKNFGKTWKKETPNLV